MASLKGQATEEQGHRRRASTECGLSLLGSLKYKKTQLWTSNPLCSLTLSIAMIPHLLSIARSLALSVHLILAEDDRGTAMGHDMLHSGGQIAPRPRREDQEVPTDVVTELNERAANGAADWTC
jgi:hypothetical protein